MWIKCFAVIGALAGAAGVAGGAFAAHAQGPRFAPAALATIDTVSRHLLVHGLLLLVIATWLRATGDAWPLRLAGALAAGGIVLFCGGLGAGALTGLRSLAALAPVGGSAFIAAWLVLALYALFKL
jgi:uncharacterized membrane protein YgdD (TMEM256/DUF423 family)